MLKKITRIINTSKNYPFNVLNFKELSLDAPVVFLTGENGSGKTTLLNVISELSESISVGKSKPLPLNIEGYFQLSWLPKLKKGYHFKSEDFFTFLLWAQSESSINESFLEEATKRHGDIKNMGYLLETGVHRSNVEYMNEVVNDYMKVSHGEGYLKYFSSKLRPNTLYLLDEPEAPLSIQNQLVLISILSDLVKKGSQFIICTHSPILMAYPDALIYYCDDNAIDLVSYDNHPVVKEYRLFLEKPERYMHYLLED